MRKNDDIEEILKAKKIKNINNGGFEEK